MKVYYEIRGTKTSRIEQAHGKPLGELIAERRIDRNMKIMDICAELGISKRTYLRYVPFEILGERRIEDESDRQRKLYWAEHARTVRLSKLVRKQKPVSDGWSWHKDMSKFFVKRKT